MSETVQKELEALFEKCDSCKGCKLSETKTNTVFGTGNIQAKVMFVGEAPGEQEDLQGEPFVGASGKLLDKYLAVIDMPRESVYIANILKCRPPHNRDPLPEEEDACIEFLRKQLQLINPKIIVCLGRIAAKRLIKPDFKITAEHGKWFEKGKYLMCAVYHPSALLRDLSKRTEMLSDMFEIKKKADELNK
ncbi:MAG: uracil-DNA glycosylase [Clostridiales bacterium]|nr:uracil-DNA glycosylase [Clostridiales bacterium]